MLNPEINEETFDLFSGMHSKLDEYMRELLRANGNRIVINDNVLLRNAEKGWNDKVTYGMQKVSEIRYENGAINVYKPLDMPKEFRNEYKIAEKMNLISAACSRAEHPAHTEYFPITALSRDNLEEAGFEQTSASDKTMRKLASLMSEAYVKDSYWRDLRFFAGNLGITSKPKDPDF